MLGWILLDTLVVAWRQLSTRSSSVITYQFDPPNIRTKGYLPLVNHAVRIRPSGPGRPEPTDSIQASMLEMAGPTARAPGNGPDRFPATFSLPDYSIGVIAGTRDTRTENKRLPVPKDGLVSLESAGLENTSDFIAFDISHGSLRNDRAVAEQVIAFLREGRSDHETGH